MPLCKRNRPVESPPASTTVDTPAPDDFEITPTGMDLKKKVMIGGGILLLLFLLRR